MKKTFLILAMLFAFLSSNLAFAGSQSYTSPWRKPYYEGEAGIDQMHVNINSYCNELHISGSFNPTYTSNPNDTYFDLGSYNNSGSGYSPAIFFYLISSNTPNSNNFSYSISDYSYWGTIDVYMNISSGIGTVTVDWY